MIMASYLCCSAWCLDWWNRFNVDINTMIQLTVVKRFTLSFIIRMNLFICSFAIRNTYARTQVHIHTNFAGVCTAAKPFITHLLELLTSRAHYTLKIEPVNFLRFERREIYIKNKHRKKEMKMKTEQKYTIDLIEMKQNSSKHTDRERNKEEEQISTTAPS